ncbi:MAG TPA: MFS transporter [Tepidisphaeraceae bacterium]|nr:MFS transporter [Tepidisphaeraceae bacterium]
MAIDRRWRVLHLTWPAFFFSFVAWFSLVPFASSIGKSLSLSAEQVQTLLICNVALTIPARIAVGMLVDRYGPRRVYSALLLAVAAPCLMCALASSYWQLVIARLLVSCVGAGFVVGIRLVGEWFDAREIGWAEGVYGGLGNFGMVGATFGLPLLALLFSPANGWRWAIGISGALCAMYGLIFYFKVSDAPEGKEFRKPKRRGALEVCSRGDLLALIFMQAPMVLCMGILAWKLAAMKLFSQAVAYAIYAGLAALLVYQIVKIVRVNLSAWRNERVVPDERYSFSQVAILCLSYVVTFGGALAVESMLPAYFEAMFGVSVAAAGAMGAGFALASLIARPLGGLLGDKYGRKPIIIISLIGATAGLAAIGLINERWPLWGAMAVVVVAGFFLMAGNGANFCIAPLIRKPLTGQIAGLIGAYGSVGSVLFLFILSLAGPGAFFVSLVLLSASACGACFFLREPGRSVIKVARPSRVDVIDQSVPAPAL